MMLSFRMPEDNQSSSNYMTLKIVPSPHLPMNTKLQTGDKLVRHAPSIYMVE